jgi:hypothetical protein
MRLAAGGAPVAVEPINKERVLPVLVRCSARISAGVTTILTIAFLGYVQSVRASVNIVPEIMPRPPPSNLFHFIIH